MVNKVMIPGPSVDRSHHFAATVGHRAKHMRTVGVNELSALVKELQCVCAGYLLNNEEVHL